MKTDTSLRTDVHQTNSGGEREAFKNGVLEAVSVGMCVHLLGSSRSAVLPITCVSFHIPFKANSIEVKNVSDTCNELYTMTPKDDPIRRV